MGRGKRRDIRAVGGTVQNVREDLGEVGEFGDVASEPQKIRVEKHDFPPMLVQGAKTRLRIELVVVGDTGR